jgi:hypothetical protein
LEPPEHYENIAGRADAEEWYEACTRELDGLIDMNFADLTIRPEGVKVI